MTRAELLDGVTIFLRLRDPQTPPPGGDFTDMSDLTDHPSHRFRIPHHRITDLPPYGSYGHINPVSSLSRAHAALVDTGRWIDGMTITDILALVRTRHEVHGEPLYLLHELYPLGPMDPDLVPGLLRKALRHHEDHRLG